MIYLHNTQSKILKKISQVRDHRWKMKVSDKLFYFCSLAECKDVHKRSQGLHLLNNSWQVSPEKSIKQSTVIDINEQFDGVSDENIRHILNNSFALELMTGCNGGCYYCVSGTKTKIFQRYSYSSLCLFFRKYGHVIKKKNDLITKVRQKFISKLHQYYPPSFSLPRYKELLMYWDTDPFSYWDLDDEGEHTLFDVYNLLALRLNIFSGHLSSTIPPGAQLHFIDFFARVADLDEGKERFLLPKVRISLAIHNVQRVEVVLFFLYYYLLGLEYPEKKVVRLLDTCIVFHIRDENTVWNVGPLINRADPFFEVLSPNSEDGYILSPSGLRSHVVCAANTYTPVGAEIQVLKRESIGHYLVTFDSLFNYAYFDDLPGYQYDRKRHVLHIKKMIIQKKVFFPLPRTKSGERYTPHKSEIDMVSFLLSRYVISCRHFCEFCTQLEKLITYDNRFDPLIRDFFIVASQDFANFGTEMKRTLNRAKELNNKMNKSNQRLKYSIKLGDMYFNLCETIVSHLQKKQEIHTIIDEVKDSLTNFFSGSGDK